MSNKNECQFCGSNNIELIKSAKNIEYKGVDLHVEQEECHCIDCDYVFETHSQLDANASAIKSKFIEYKHEYKKQRGLLIGADIKNIRKNLGLNQHAASNLFGGGLNAFSKYENEEVVQSVSMDRLMRMVDALGGRGLELLKNIAENKTPSHHHYSEVQIEGVRKVSVAEVRRNRIKAEPYLNITVNSLAPALHRVIDENLAIVGTQANGTAQIRNLKLNRTTQTYFDV